MSTDYALAARVGIYRSIDWRWTHPSVASMSAAIGPHPTSPITPTAITRQGAMFPAATILAPLMMRKFKIGQPLLYHPANRVKVKGRFIVIRLFPQLDGKVQYRIRSEEDASLEYTANASELRASVSPRPGHQ